MMNNFKRILDDQNAAFADLRRVFEEPEGVNYSRRGAFMAIYNYLKFQHEYLEGMINDKIKQEN